MAKFDIPDYLSFLPAELLERLQSEGEAVASVDGLVVAIGLRDRFPQIESDECLSFVCDIYRSTKQHLDRILRQRAVDREFIDKRTAELRARNADCDIQSPDYETVIGLKDETGRVVAGPADLELADSPQVVIPKFLQGFQVTLFGPPDTARMSINAMNALHRKPIDEPAIVTELVEALGNVPRWGADNEDSKTPIMTSFLQACENLTGCFDRSLEYIDPKNGKTYQLRNDGLSLPIKRIPGLALPDGNHLLAGNPLPLHLYDFATHVFHNWQKPEALVFYIPKLENEEEAAYISELISETEQRIQLLHPEYQIGTIKLFVVFENPRAIFRVREIAAALAPWFLGGSLGWHDFLASTARLFKNDPQYRIPVKADPNIVINHIRESHRILVESLQPIDAISIGGMYGVLSEEGNQNSYDVSIAGFIKDVITQLRRGLDGFWVAHPAFVRPGLALAEAFKRKQENKLDNSIEKLSVALVASVPERKQLLAFLDSPDADGLHREDPRYQRAVLAATLSQSNFIANNDPEEIRYNVFQAIQYLADWLCGNGCVALPATIKNAEGKDVFVRIMDDLATTERSRWEIWAEIYHKRFSVSEFERILQEELQFIRAGKDLNTKRIQVRFEGEAIHWYTIAEKILRQLATSSQPVEFASQLLLPFTLESIRKANDPWAAAKSLCPGKYADKC